MNSFIFSTLPETRYDIFATFGQTGQWGEVNLLAPVVSYLGTHFVTSIVFAVNPVEMLAYEITASAVDLLSGAFFAESERKDGDRNFRYAMQTLTPLALFTLAGYAAVPTLAYAATSVATRFFLAYYTSNEREEFLREIFG
ncbi:MAG: hypothetical protein KDK48_03240 [Chlamydiia bacterium]|nr:hypothetical protein [Chlamydiia bacterium]